MKKIAISNAKRVDSQLAPGKHNAGDNLYLVNDLKKTNSGNRLYRYWTFIYALNGKRREMALGSVEVMSLSEARRKALEARILLNDGVDPMVERAATKRAAVAVPSFGEFADEYVVLHRSRFRNDKHAAQWKTTLGDAYCKAIRSRPVSAIDTEAVLSVLQPVWTQVPETASRLRGRIENVLDAAKVRGYYHGENPARWKGHLKAILPARQRLTRGHHSALAYAQLPKFMVELRNRGSMASLALELCILTATRTSEILNAQWIEFDLAKSMWIIPARRMKAGHEHRIPLSGRAIAILEDLPKPKDGNYIFASTTTGKPLSSMAMAMQLRRLGRNDITVHGFRSSFRDWASEQTAFPHETCEHALAHRISDKAEAAYRRGDQFEKRKELMQAWANFCA